MLIRGDAFGPGIAILSDVADAEVIPAILSVWAAVEASRYYCSVGALQKNLLAYFWPRIVSTIRQLQFNHATRFDCILHERLT